MYAFFYQPVPPLPKDDGREVYNPLNEFSRQGITITTDEWRFTNINEEYQVCPTYPRTLVVPAKINDPALWHAAKYRSKQRLPVLTYYHNPTKVGFVYLLQNDNCERE